LASLFGAAVCFVSLWDERFRRVSIAMFFNLHMFDRAQSRRGQSLFRVLHDGVRMMRMWTRRSMTSSGRFWNAMEGN